MGLTTLGELCKYGFNLSGKVGIPMPATLKANKQTPKLLGTLKPWNNKIPAHKEA